MKFRKLISVLVASVMLISLVSVNVSAEVEFNWEDAYFISNVADVADRTPYIQTAVTQLTGDEVAALKGGTSGLPNLRLATTTGKLGDTSAWTVYRIDGTIKNVGTLGAGYDINETPDAYVKVKTLSAAMDFTDIVALGAKGTNWYFTADTSVQALGAQWQVISSGTTGGVAITLPTPYPTESETAEGELINEDYSFRAYLAVPVGTSTTISYDSGSASVNYWIGNASEGYSNQVVENKIASRSASFAIAESASTEVITNPVGGTIDAVGASTDSDNLRNLQGEKVTLTQNYGAAKFSEVIDTATKNYFLVLNDGTEEVERAINFAEQGIEAGGANITFFAIVKAGSHVLQSIKLKATDKE